MSTESATSSANSVSTASSDGNMASNRIEGNAGEVRALREDLLVWYAEHRRDLPFRDVSDPYAVLISEVMLQQTQVARVVPFYRAWMTTFPDIRTLAEAPLDAVLRAWQGLGYYARARNLHKAAAVMVEQHGGHVPDDFEALLALPGIGEYTAGAVASIAFGQRVSAVDGNVRRVLARLFAIEDDPARAVGARKLRALAEDLADWPVPGDLNQALMEFGATVCRPRNPGCESCSLSEHCAAFGLGRQHELPLRPKRMTRTKRQAFAWRIVRPADGAILIARRREEGLLGGLWEYPLVVVDRAREPSSIDDHDVHDETTGANGADGAAATREMKPPLGLVVDSIEQRDDVTHVFSHLELNVTTVRASARSISGDHLRPATVFCAAAPSAATAAGAAAPSSRVAAQLSIRERDAEYLLGEHSVPIDGDVQDRTATYEAYRWVAPEDLAKFPRSVLMEKLERAMDDA